MPASIDENVLPTIPGPLHTPPAGVAVKITAVSVRHTLGGALVKVILGNGLTVIVKLRDVPGQLTPPLLNVGVTVIVAVIANGVVFIAVKLAILPVPLAASPMPVLLLVQV